MANSVESSIRSEMISNGISNALFNGLIAMQLAHAGQTIPLIFLDGKLASHSIAIDIAATSTILLFILALIIIPLNGRKLSRQHTDPMVWQQDNRWHRLLMALPQSLFGRACCFALAGLFIATPLSLGYYSLLGVEQMTSEDYAVAKGLWAGMLAAMACIPMVQLGLSAD